MHAQAVCFTLLNANVKLSLIFQSSEQCDIGPVQRAWMYDKKGPIKYGRSQTVYKLRSEFQGKPAVIKFYNILPQPEINCMLIAGQLIALGREQENGGRWFAVLVFLGEAWSDYFQRGIALRNEAKTRYSLEYKLQRKYVCLRHGYLG